jgi:hypothetical protein
LIGVVGDELDDEDGSSWCGDAVADVEVVCLAGIDVLAGGCDGATGRFLDVSERAFVDGREVAKAWGSRCEIKW